MEKSPKTSILLGKRSMEQLMLKDVSSYKHIIQEHISFSLRAARFSDLTSGKLVQRRQKGKLILISHTIRVSLASKSKRLRIRLTG